MLDEQTKGCAFYKGDCLGAEKKRMYMLSPLFGIFDFFFFFKFLTRLKKKKRMLCYKRGMSVAGKKTSFKHIEHINSQCYDTCAG
jgi:hypothetical protein